MPDNDEIRTSVKQEDYVETKDGVVTNAFASILLSIELDDLVMMETRYEPITEAEWLDVVDHLCHLIGQELHEHIGDALDAVYAARNSSIKKVN